MDPRAPLPVRRAWIPSSYRALAAAPDYRRLAFGSLVSSVGDGMSAVAIAWQALELASQGTRGPAVAAAIAAYTLPGILGGFVFSRPLRRASARSLILFDSLLRAVTLGAAAALGAMGLLGLWSFVALLALSSLFHPWGIAGQRSLVPELVDYDDRLAANALLLTQQHVSFVVGPALAGVVTGVAGPAASIAIDAGTFVVLAWVAGRLPVSASAVRTQESRGALRSLLTYPRIALLLGMTWIFYMLYGPVEVALPIFVKSALSGSAAVLGVLWAAFGVGAAAGGFAAPRLKTIPLWWLVVGIILGWGLAVVGLALSRTALHAGAWLFIGGIVYGPYTAITTTTLQGDVAAEDLAGVNATWASAIVGAAPLGTLLGGPLVAAVGAIGALLASGGATVLLGFAGAVTVPRARRRATTGPPSDAEG